MGMMGKINHSQSTQSNKFAISLQYLKKKLGMELIFCMQIDIKISTSWIIIFDKSSQTSPKFAK